MDTYDVLQCLPFNQTKLNMSVVFLLVGSEGNAIQLILLPD